MADEPTVYPTEAVWVRDPAVGGEPYKGFPFPGLDRLKTDAGGNLELDKNGDPVPESAKASASKAKEAGK